MFFLLSVLNYLFGVMPGVARDEIVDGSEIGLGRFRPDYHESISRLSSSLLSVRP